MPRSPSHADIYAGARLRAARLLAGLSQTELGDYVQISFQQIQKYEKGSNRISASRLQQFAQILNVPPSYFFQEEQARKVDESALLLMDRLPANVSQRMLHELLHHFLKIPSEEMRNRIALLVKACADASELPGGIEAEQADAA